MPPDGAIQVAFDRYLLPETVTRQAIQLLDGAGNPLPPELVPFVVYDPVARTVTLTRQKPGAWLTPGQPYKLRFLIAQGDDDLFGLRAIDRATLEPSQKLEYAFFVGADDGGAAAAATTGIPGEPTNVSFCKDVMPIFVTKCSSGRCHGSGDRAAASLVLDTAIGVRNTAINRVAQGANNGAIAGRPSAPGKVFGVDMPIVATNDDVTGDPGNSWLVYKLELAPSPTAGAGAKPAVTCAGGTGSAGADKPYTALAGATRSEPDDIERGALRDLVTGNQMPYPVDQATSYFDQSLTFQERETIRMWIARGAHVEDCGACAVGP